MSDQLPKLTLTARPTRAILLKYIPKELDTKFGKSYLYNLDINGQEMVYFASPKTKEKIEETGAEANDEIILTKTQLETGKSWITVELCGMSDSIEKKSVPGYIDQVDDRQKLITSQFLIGRAVDVWVRLNAYDPASYTVSNMRLELVDIATDIHRALTMYMQDYYEDPKRLPRNVQKRLEDDTSIPF